MRKLNWFFILIAISGLYSVAYASQIAYETFDYPTGELNGLGGGSGWSGNWTAVTAVTEILDSTATPMSYSVPSGGQVVDGQRILRVSGDNNAAVQRTLAASQTGTFYISFLVRFNGTINNNDFAAIWFGTQNGPNIGIKGDSATNTPANPDIMVRTQNSGPEQYHPTSMTAGQTYFVVGRISKDATNYDRYQLWVNPGFTDSATPTAEATGTGANSITTVSTVGLRSVNLDVGDSVDISGITMGTTWDDVVPAPGVVLSVGLQNTAATPITQFPVWLIVATAVLVLFTIGRVRSTAHNNPVLK